MPATSAINNWYAPVRKKIIKFDQQASSNPVQEWLDLEELAEVEMTSEDASYPIEFALLPGLGLGWRAAQSGHQKIRLIFHKPLEIKRIFLKFEEFGVDRTQEYVLRWESETRQTLQEIVRQQWNFSPGATIEIEDHHVGLKGVTMLELEIIPDISGKTAFASLAQMRLA